MQPQDASTEKQVAFMELYEPIHDRFVRFCQTRMHNSDETQDLINETILRAYENFEKLRNKDAFLHYLFGIATRIRYNQYRREKFKGAYQEEKHMYIPDMHSRPDEKADIYFLYKALEQLPEKQKEAIILFEISGFSIKEIQVIQDSKASAVKARLSRGRKKLTKILGESTYLNNNVML